MLEQCGDQAEALALYQRADERGNADGSFNLGCLLAELGDLERAIAALRRATERGDAAGASNLGVLLEGQGDLDGAEKAYRLADDRGDANGSFNLGLLLAGRGDLAGADAAYRRAQSRGRSDAVGSLALLGEHTTRDLADTREQSANATVSPQSLDGAGSAHKRQDANPLVRSQVPDDRYELTRRGKKVRLLALAVALVLGVVGGALELEGGRGARNRSARPIGQHTVPQIALAAAAPVRGEPTSKLG